MSAPGLSHSQHSTRTRHSSNERKSGSRESSMDGRKSSSREKHERRREKDTFVKPTAEHLDKEALEKKVEELTRQLAEEKQTSRRSVAKLQREVARLKSERSYAQRGESREGLMKEVERERVLRSDAEQRLQEMREESDCCRSRLHSLQAEFKKMEDTVRSMMQYKTKIDQLKQEKSNLSATYDSNLQKYRSHISGLERENMMLLNEVKKLESQLSGKGDEQDKSKLLLQRLKMLEAENSGLVLENEQQRHQYEKCLDEIANQVVQALLAQKTLREECMKLQGRVQDLEMQNRQLNIMFQQRLRCASDSLVHTMPTRKVPPGQTSETKSQIPVVSMTAVVHPHSRSQTLPSVSACTTQASSVGPTDKGEATPKLESSTGSLQSMCSEYISEDSPGKPQMSSPPPWLRDKLDLTLTDESRPSSSDNSPITPPTPTLADSLGKASSSPALPSKLETEFPVNNSSPKVKRVLGLERGCQSLDRIGVAKKPSNQKNITRPHRKPKTLTKKSSSVKNVNTEAAKPVEVLPPPSPRTKSRIPSRVPTPTSNQGVKRLSGEQTPEKKIQGPKHSTPQSFHDLMSQRKKALSRDSSPKSGTSPKAATDSPRHTLPFRSQYYYDYSDEDSDSKPVSRDSSTSSTASTVSLNDLLDSSLDNPLDEDFLSDWSPSVLSPGSLNSSSGQTQSQIPVMSKGMFYHYKTPNQSSKTVKSGPYTDIIVKDGVATVVKSEEGYSGCKPLRPDNLILVPREKQFSCGFSSSSSSSSAEEPKSLISSVRLNTIQESKVDRSKESKEENKEIDSLAGCSKTTGNGLPSSDNKNCVVANVSMVTPPAKVRRVPPPVPLKPSKLPTLSMDIAAAAQKDVKGKGLIMDKDGMPFLSENLTVEKQKDLAAFLVQDVIERVKSREVMAYHQKNQSSDSSFESVRVERSGSKDDGYSTMSSDIQPEILEKFSDAATQKVEIQIRSEKGELSVEPCVVKTKDAFTDVMSDHDSAMETSTHSMELRNSNQSLSSQMSSSSCESAVSPILKVNDMKKFFEEEARKKGAKLLTSPCRSPILSPKSPKKHWPFERDRHVRSPIASKPIQTAEVTSPAKDSTSEDDGSVPAADIIFQNFSSLSEDSSPSPEQMMTSLHISEDKLLEDIPEDGEWKPIHLNNMQETPQRSSITHPHVVRNSNENLPSKVQAFTQKLPSITSLKSIQLNASTKLPSLCLSKAKSDSNLSNAGQSKSTSVYEDFTEGNWDSGKVPERSASVSEMDFQPAPSVVNIVNFSRRLVPIDIDETAVLYRVHTIVKEYCQAKMSPSLNSDSESDSEAQINFIELLKEKSQRPFSLPTWAPKQTMEIFTKNSTPSPVSVKKFDESQPEDWLLQFSQEEICQHMKHTELPASANGASHSDSQGSVSQCAAPVQMELRTSGQGNNSQELATEDSPRSPPSEEQTKFNSNFYSLCNMGSKSSLFSNGSHDQGINKLVPTDSHQSLLANGGEESIESREFEEISRQIANLSRTVNDLHRSLSSLNSDPGSIGELADCAMSTSVDKSSSQSATALDGYHWVDDEFCMASCGGEVIIGSHELLADDSPGWMEEFVEDTGSTMDSHMEEFYEIQVNGTSFADLPGYTYRDQGPAGAGGSKKRVGLPRRHLSDSHVADPEKRADLLDSMLASGGESNDSLASDIGLDHMMCQRLIGRRRQARHEVVRYPANSRPPLDFSKFFIRYGEPEREAVAAFDFLDEMSNNSESASLPKRSPRDPGSEGGRSRGQGHKSDHQRIITTSSGRVRKVDKNKRKRRGDAMKAQKQRENNSRIGMSHVSQDDSPDERMGSDTFSAGNLSLSDSCCEEFSSSNPSVNNLTML